VIVLDASLVVELVTNGPSADVIREELAATRKKWIIPQLADVEAISALRRLVALGRFPPGIASGALVALASFPAERQPHTQLLGRIWELRHNFTAYDATYIALAEATDATLYTLDVKLSKGHRAQVRVFSK
jgi:predicted nucleic acid-binding protein